MDELLQMKLMGFLDEARLIGFERWIEKGVKLDFESEIVVLGQVRWMGWSDFEEWHEEGEGSVDSMVGIAMIVNAVER